MEEPGNSSSPFTTISPSTPRLEPLSDVLESLALRAWIAGQIRLTAPWGIRVGPGSGWFCLATGERCLVDTEGNDTPASVTAGDLIIVPQGRHWRLRDTVGSPTTAIESLLGPDHLGRQEPLLHRGGEASTSLLCGCFVLDNPELSPLRAMLPAMIHVKGEGRQPRPYVDHILHLVCQEAESGEPCAPIIISRLVRILLVKAIQGHMAQLPRGSTGWLSALSDPNIGRALGLMHAQTDAPWTAAALAECVAMSRSTFCARFTEMVGTPPLEYLTHWRMQKACLLLRMTRVGLKEVAAQVGYETAAAFSRAFTRWTGTTPSTYRNAARAAPSWDHARTRPVPHSFERPGERR